MVKKEALATCDFNKAYCCKFIPIKKTKPVANAMTSKFFWKIILLIFFVSKINARGNTAKNPRDVRAKLNVNGPICPIPIAWATKAVPQINDANNKRRLACVWPM